MKFEDLRLSEPIVRAVAEQGYTRPTPIQCKAIPHVLAGSDLLGCAQTGTGKTAAFALPILHLLSNNKHKSASGGNRQRKPRTLILCPTRELGAQIGESFRVYGRHTPIKHTTIYGGVNQNPQVKALRNGVDVIIATPGRLLDLMNQGHVDLSGIEVFVLDEADRMLDMGFLPDIRKISARVPRKRQTLLFSATMPTDIRNLAATILHNPISVQVDPVSSVVQTISQSVYHVPKKSKPALLKSMLRGEAAGRTLVFTRTKHGADRVVKELLRANIHAAAIHGNKSQNARTRALASFKSKSPPVLVATDIASRGIDVDDIMHVINFDLPHEPETYIHRIGRTARAGASGAAVSFCDPDERGYLRSIERLTGAKIVVRTDQPEIATAAGAAAVAEKQPARTAPQLGRRMSKKRYSQEANGRSRSGSSSSSSSSPSSSPSSSRRPAAGSSRTGNPTSTAGKAKAKSSGRMKRRRGRSGDHPMARGAR